MDKINILIVEDENIVAKDIEFNLNNLGYNCIGNVSSGQKAIDKAIESKPDLVLMDIMLKGDMDGIKAAEIIREKLNIPIIFITAYFDKKLIEKAKITEPYAYMLKPFSQRELHTNIEIALYKHQAEKEIKQSRMWLQKTLENISDGVITTDINGLITYSNPVAQKIIGFKSSELKEKNISQVFNVYEQNTELSIDEILKTILDNGKTINYENGLILSNDRIKQVFINNKISPIKNADDKIIGIVFIFRDITEKKQSKEILRLIVDSTLSSIGDDFFKSLVQQLAKTLDVSFAFICELKDIDKKICRVISSWEVDAHGENIDFFMQNTPSEAILNGNLVFYPNRLQYLFPKDPLLKNNNIESYIGIPMFDAEKNIIGHLGVMHNKPIKENSVHQSILKFMSQRVAMELIRKKSEEVIKESEEKFRQLTNSLPHTIFEMDKNYKFTFVNNYVYNSFGYKALEMLDSMSMYDILAIEEKEKADENVKKVLNGENIDFSEYSALKKDLTLFPVLIYYSPVFNKEHIISGVRAVIVDISKLRSTEKALKDSEERYSLTFKSINDGFWDWNIITNEMYFSPRWKYMLGYEDHEIINSLDQWFNRVHHDDLINLKEKLDSYVNNLFGGFEQEYRILHKNGKYVWFLAKGNAVKDSKGTIYRVFGSQIDINQHKVNEKLLENLLHNASHDFLTGLPNRSMFLEKLEKSIFKSKSKKDYNFAVLFVDIDRFKVINESLGHNIGNILLVEAAIKLQLCLRPEDTIARFGSDEFAILIEEIESSNDALNVAKRIQKEMIVPFLLNEHEIFVSLSIGISTSSTNYEGSEEIIRDAEIAMRRAKNIGRSRYELFDSDMHTQALELLQIETDLRYAIERKEFVLYYQPIISLKTGKITGFEALIRWIHPKKGIIGSDIFIPIAEETGMIIPIGVWVLQEACQQIKIWQTKFDNNVLTMSINISGKQFSSSKLLDNISQTIIDTKVDPVNIKLEITESTIMENADKARSMLEQIRELNIQLQIDDFGTGYSSLSYLHRFPVNSLKIDRSFVSRIGANDENVEIVRTIVSLAKNLNMEAIAEGIETFEQLKKLKSLDCEYGQGYFISRPVPVKDIEKLMGSNPVW
ncbi:MAG: EAL domain-containing protein [Candidatus Sericytochromatia bacterium]|nr:EAL domain-containing protein [Candidatus Sericytochromatia bacterium]